MVVVTAVPVVVTLVDGAIVPATSGNVVIVVAAEDVSLDPSLCVRHVGTVLKNSSFAYL